MISKESLQFLSDLKKNNNRDWFLANKKRYEVYKKEYYDLAQQFLDALKSKDETLDSLEVKNCVFRVNRDIRFSKDKSPYKTHMGLWFSPGKKNANRAGYYIHIEPGASFMAGGFYQPDATELRRLRKEIAFFHDELEDILKEKKFKAVFENLGRGNALKTAPKGYEKDHPAIELLQLKSFEASAKLADKALLEKDFVQQTADQLLLLQPLTVFLNRALTAED